MQALRSPEQIRDVNTRYHDVAAGGYDSKWGIDFGQTGSTQVLAKARKGLGSEIDRGFQRGLEVGAGTGYFGLHLRRAGVVSELTCTDISAGMLDALSANARRLGLEAVTTVRAEAARLPFPDQSFDLVFGHAILHHLPALEQAFSEFHRVLRPEGRILFAGEPSAVGDRLARVPKRAARLTAPLWRRALGAAAAGAGHEDPATQEEPDVPEHQLEGQVDIHTFEPSQLAALARGAGLADVEVRGEELLANWFGWFNRGLEATVAATDVPGWWRQYAFHGYLWLQRLDRAALEPRLPVALFYNLLLSGRRPADG
jgi:ubiquinone/menaquinone biosynthesis C-methylase UbiE